MKIRYGFVSNSSTTSFCIAGYYIEDEDLKDRARNSSIEKDMSYYSNDYSFYLGLDIDNMKDNETKQEFLTRAKETIDKLFPELKDKEIGLLTDGWYNG
jgi:hypothetical protein